jgi:hypothetical protein
VNISVGSLCGTRGRRCDLFMSITNKVISKS